MKRLLPALLALALCGALFAQTRPLVLQSADRMSGSKTQGLLTLQGGVKFRYDDATFSTELAKWNQNLDQVNCTGGFRFDDPGGRLSAETGIYDRRNDKAMAQGAARLRDSTGNLRLDGDRIVWNRRTSLATAEGNPKLTAVEADSSDPKALRWDTLTIDARRFEVDREGKVARATGRVFAVRGDLRVWCDTGTYRWEEGTMELSGSPRAAVGDVEISGKEMRIELEKRRLKRIKVAFDVTGRQRAFDRRTRKTQCSQVDGDTLEAWFDGELPRAFEARGSAVGHFYEEERGEYVNRADGAFLRLDFRRGKPDRGEVTGSAKTVYYHFDEEALEGRNEAVGDTVELGFSPDGIRSVRIRGTASGGAPASGIYYGEKKGPARDAAKAEDGRKREESQDRLDAGPRQEVR